MRSRLAIWAFGVVLLLLVGGENGGVFGSGNCGFPALFNFGDSNSDTGAASAASGEKLLPFGVTIGKKSKRITDGRVIIDFLGKVCILLTSVTKLYHHHINITSF